MVFLFLILIIILNRVPVVGKIFKIVSTMFHELGHALMTVLTSGKVYGIYLFHDVRGMASTGSRNWISKVLVTLAGYPTEAAMSYLLLFLFANKQYEVLLYVLFGAILITMFFIRNLYGFIWLLSFGMISFLAYSNIQEIWVNYLLLGIVLITVGEALVSSINILYLSLKRKKQAGDATALAEATKIPALVWGILFFVFSSFLFFHMIDLLGMVKISTPFK